MNKILKKKKQISIKKVFSVTPKKIFRGFIFFLLGVYLLVGFSSFTSVSPEEIALSEALVKIKNNEVKKVVVYNDKIELSLEGDKTVFAQKEPEAGFTDVLKNSEIDPASIDFQIDNQNWMKAAGNILATLLPLGLMALLFLYIFKQMGRAQNSVFSFGKSKAKLFIKGKQSTRFKDVAGLKEVKEELMEVVDFLKRPEKYRKVKARTPKGALLVGPSGVGKTLLARAVAGEAGVSFFSMAGSEFMEMLVGVGASVTGDTPVLIKKDDKVKLIPIGEFVDSHYHDNEAGLVKKVKNVETLGFEKAKNRFWGTHSIKSDKSVFSGSEFKQVEGVYRHKVKEIYEIHFLGGKLRTTGDHSIFVRKQGYVFPKKASELKSGDLLVNLPMNTRYWDYKKRKTIHKIKKHLSFSSRPLYLDIWNDDPGIWEKYNHIIANPDNLYQSQLAAQSGVCQMTISNWQRQIHVPRLVSKKLVKLKLPRKVKMSSSLLKLFGLYTAEGRGTNNLELVFGSHEPKLIQETVNLMKEVFGLKKPVLEKTISNSIRVKYYSAHLGRFFSRWCGNGSHNKHIPNFLWTLPKELFLAYLEGYSQGDGYITKSGKLSCCSVSKQLIFELSWLCSMHGIKAGIKHEIVSGGRVICSKPLPDSEAWKLIIGKTSNPFLKEKVTRPYQFKRCIVKKIVKKKFNGYVYDLCGVENEAFFGGEKPVLLHNSRVRDLFSTAKKMAPSIIFIDEIDAIGRARGGLGVGGGHDEREQTLNQILVEMDGFESNDRVLVVAATNRGDLLDPALLRPGRFDRRFVLTLPDIEEREEILRLHAKGKPFRRVKWERMSRQTVGFSGADLENMVNEAAILAARGGKITIGEAQLEEAALKVKLGPEKRRLQSENDKKITAYHESGHAVVSQALPDADPVSRVSIISRGMALGYTLIPPKKDRLHETKTYILSQISVLLGGRAAEELKFNEMTTGAGSDIEQATKLARRMVIDFGMSSLGPINLGPQVDVDGWQGAYFPPQEVSAEMKAKVDKEVKMIIDKAYKRAKDVLVKESKVLDVVAEKLVEKETLDQDEFEKLIKSAKQAD